jgi:TetR/AcrR family transcriptional regulator
MPEQRDRAAARSTPAAQRTEIEQRILRAAKPLFAQQGYRGVSIDRIAAAAGLSKQNLLYYFPRKELLYRAVLGGVLDVWLSYMDALSQREDCLLYTSPSPRDH